MEILRTSDVAIITNEIVETSFDNIPCRLLARIAYDGKDPITLIRKYRVRTDLVAYQDYINIITPAVEEVLDVENNVIVEAVPAVTEERQRLIWVEEKQKWSLQEVEIDEFLAFDSYISQFVPEGLNPEQLEVFKIKSIFLIERKMDEPWGVDASLWRTLNPEELDIVKP